MIHLTDSEIELFSVLDIFALKHDVTLRVAGGWVRDKLLGIQSHDIDIAIDNMSGVAFSELLSKSGLIEKYSQIKANPSKSKHLETTNILFSVGKICFAIDFVELRQEIYDEKSRMPEIKKATPEQDATRRDLTINAMFYNLRTKTIEDFTKKGLDDLKVGILRTPDDPLKTFRDDPLRILRVARFVSQLGFVVDDAISEAVSDKSVQKSFCDKVSKERIVIELDKLFRGKYVNQALSVITDWKFWKCIFDLPDVNWEIVHKQYNQYFYKQIFDKTGYLTLLLFPLYDKFPKKREMLNFDLIKLRWKFDNETTKIITYLMTVLNNFSWLDTDPGLIYEYTRTVDNKLEMLSTILLLAEVIYQPSAENKTKMIEMCKSKEELLKTKLPVDGEYFLKLGFKGADVGKQIMLYGKEYFRKN